MELKMSLSNCKKCGKLFKKKIVIYAMLVMKLKIS